MHFDNSISVGSIAAVVAILAMGWKIMGSIKGVQFKVDLMWDDYGYRKKLYAHAKENGELE